MEQYISKSALVAEIERLKTIYNNDENIHHVARYNILVNILSFINTLEVREVDMEKEAELIANDIMIGVQANKYNTVVYNTKRCDFNHSHLMLAARKGIELGLKARKGE